MWGSWLADRCIRPRLVEQLDDRRVDVPSFVGLRGAYADGRLRGMTAVARTPPAVLADELGPGSDRGEDLAEPLGVEREGMQRHVAMLGREDHGLHSHRRILRPSVRGQETLMILRMPMLRTQNSGMSGHAAGTRKLVAARLQTASGRAECMKLLPEGVPEWTMHDPAAPPRIMPRNKDGSGFGLSSPSGCNPLCADFASAISGCS